MKSKTGPFYSTINRQIQPTMSNYFGGRRRLSEQDSAETPQPRSQWRMRVNSLMMDDRPQASSVGKRWEQKFAPDGRSRGMNTKRDSTSDETSSRKRNGEELTHLDSRRNRFSRTSSDGQMRYRVRLSRHENSGDISDEDQCVFKRGRGEPRSRVYSDREERKRIDDDGHSTPRFDRKECSPQTMDDEMEHRGSHSFMEPGGQKSDLTDEAQLVGAVGGRPLVEKQDSESVRKQYRTTSSLTKDEDFDENRAPDFITTAKSNSLGKDELDRTHREYGSYQRPDSTRGLDRNLKPLVSENESDISGMGQSRSDLVDFNTYRNMSSKVEELDTFDAALASDEEMSDACVRGSSPICDISREGDFDRAQPILSIHEADQVHHDTSARPGASFFNFLEPVNSNTPPMVLETPEVLEGTESPETINGSGVEFETSEIESHDANSRSESENNVNHEAVENNTIEDLMDGACMSGYTRFLTASDREILRQAGDAMQDEENSISINDALRLLRSCSPTKDASRSQDVRIERDEKDIGNSWSDLPAVLMEDVLTMLSPKERHYASQVCRPWYDHFYSPRVWETFVLLERTLTKKRFNLYKGYQRELCPGKTQQCFRRVGSFFKRIIVTPIRDYFNLYEFLRILAAFLQHQEEHDLEGMPLLHTFELTFAGASRDDSGMLVHGTGGQILSMIEELLARMSNLRHLKLNQLMIDPMDIYGLFNSISNCFGESLHTLEIVNLTKVPVALEGLAEFRNLIKLTVSPQHISEEILVLLGGLNLLQLHLLQDYYTCDCQPVHYEAWKLLKEMAPWMKVYLELGGGTKSPLLIQPRAPVHGIFLRTPYSRLDNDLAMSVVEHYSQTLNYFVQERLPRVHGPRGFNGRCDSSLLFLVRRCVALHTLVIRERISTCTLMLVAHEGKKLSTLLVRQHALIKRCDWPKCGEFSREFYSRLREASLDYPKCVDEICNMLKRHWRPLTDKQFMQLKMVANR